MKLDIKDAEHRTQMKKLDIKDAEHWIRIKRKPPNLFLLLIN